MINNPAKRSILRSAGVYLGLLIVGLLLGIWVWNFGFTPIAPPVKTIGATASKPEFQKLTGRWQRPDGAYILAISSVADSGAIDAGYFNPNPIHVAKAEASYDGEAAKVFIELRDVNYPGSTYTLTYDPASDQLRGLYYQAVEDQRFTVFFARMR